MQATPSRWDKTHIKSMLLLHGAGSDDFGIDPFACGRAVDLAEEIICMGGAGVDEARALKTEIEARLQADIDKMGGDAKSKKESSFF